MLQDKLTPIITQPGDYIIYSCNYNTDKLELKISDNDKDIVIQFINVVSFRVNHFLYVHRILDLYEENQKSNQIYLLSEITNDDTYVNWLRDLGLDIFFDTKQLKKIKHYLILDDDLCIEVLSDTPPIINIEGTSQSKASEGTGRGKP